MIRALTLTLLFVVGIVFVSEARVVINKNGKPIHVTIGIGLQSEIILPEKIDKASKNFPRGIVSVNYHNRIFIRSAGQTDPFDFHVITSSGQSYYFQVAVVKDVARHEGSITVQSEYDNKKKASEGNESLDEYPMIRFFKAMYYDNEKANIERKVYKTTKSFMIGTVRCRLIREFTGKQYFGYVLLCENTADVGLKVSFIRPRSRTLKAWAADNEYLMPKPRNKLEDHAGLHRSLVYFILDK